MASHKIRKFKKILRDKTSLSDFISDQYELDEFWEAVYKIKQEKEKKSLDSIINVSTRYNYSRKRI